MSSRVLLVPEERRAPVPIKSDEEKTAEMKLAYLKGAMHGVLADMRDYYAWLKIKRPYRNKVRWAMKTTLYRQFMSHFERRIQELERNLEKIKYVSPKQK